MTAPIEVRVRCCHPGCGHEGVVSTLAEIDAFTAHFFAHTIAPGSAPTDRQVAQVVPGEQASTGTPAVPVLATTRPKETHE